MVQTATSDIHQPPAGRTPRTWPVAVAVGALAFVVLAGAILVFSWMVDETRFDRPSARFDAFTADLESLPGVSEVESDRWVEAPMFANPTSSVTVTVAARDLPAVLDAACASSYPDPVTWAVLVRTESDAVVSLHSEPSATRPATGAPACPHFGVDAVPLVGAIDRAVPGLGVQATRGVASLLLVAIDEDDIAAVIPMIEHADDLLVAAGYSSSDPIEVNSLGLSTTVATDERDRYVDLLTALAGMPSVVSFATGDARTWTDGVARSQVIMTGGDRAEVERLIRASGLRIAELPIQVIEQ